MSSSTGELIPVKPIIPRPVEEILLDLQIAATEEGWGLPESIYDRLGVPAVPPRPTKPNEDFSFQLRFGFGEDGVEKTFRAHVGRILRVTGAPEDSKIWPASGRPLDLDAVQVRLVEGNEAHHPTLRWVVIRPTARRRRTSLLPDECFCAAAAETALVYAWLNPDYLRGFNHGDVPAWLLAGYRLTLPGCGAPWTWVPGLDVDAVGTVTLVAHRADNIDPGYSVPVSVPCPMTAGLGRL